MMNAWNTFCLTVVDALLGWMLSLPINVVVVVVAVGSGAILTLARIFTTDQTLLRIASEDRKRQKQLAKQAKAAGDKEAAKRHMAVRNTISVMTLGQEWKPLVVSLLPIAMLATWAVERLEFIPPSAGDPVSLVAYVPRFHVGETLHIVPNDALVPRTSWMAEIIPGEVQGVPCGEARWMVEAVDPNEPLAVDLSFRLGEHTLMRELILGENVYATPQAWFPEVEVRIDTELEQVKPFGVVPGIPALMFPPWLVAYILLVIPSVFLVKRLFGIH